MTLAEKLASVLPPHLPFAELERLAPAAWWRNMPEQAAIYALTASSRFDAAAYLELNPDVRAAGMEPARHYVRHGIWENRQLPLRQQPGGIAAATRPQISALMPVFNNAAYLRECIESVLTQTLRSLELIIVNDGSTDLAAVRIMREYAASDARIRLINKANSGYGHSMNVAMDAACGEYMVIVESDDYIAPRMFEILYTHASAGGYDFVKSNYVEFVDGKMRRFTYIDIDQDRTRYNRPIDPRKEPQILLAPEIVINPPSVTSLDFVRRHKIKFNESPGASFQDLGFFMRRYLYASRILYIPDYLYYVRKDNATSSHKRRDKIFCAYEEYAVIDSLLQSDFDRRGQFGKYVFFRKWNSIKFTMGRIGAEFRSEYLAKVGRDLCISRICGEIDPAIITPWNCAQIDDICDNYAEQPRICVIYANHLGYGGLERSACELGRALASLGFDVIYILDDPAVVTFSICGKVVKNSANATVFRIVDECVFFIDYKYKPNGSQNPLVRYAISRHPRKYVLTAHNTKAIGNYIDLSLRYLAEASLPQNLLGGIFCASAQVKKLLAGKCANVANIAIIPNVVELPRIQSNAIAKNNYLLSLCRKDAVQNKGLDILLEAYAASDAPKSGVRLLLAGHGELPADLAAWLAASPIAPLVDVLDFQEDVAALYKNAVCVLVPSRWEGFGMVTAEALAAGTPVVATPVGIAEEVIKPGVNGYLTELENAADLAEKISLALKNEAALKENLKTWQNPFSRGAVTALLERALTQIEKAIPPLVSVIMPVYNASATVERAAQSVLKQTLANIELICVDDGSTDDSLAILRRAGDARLHVFEQEHSGSGPARNLGLAQATGEYIFFLDSDDWLPESSALKEMYFTAKRHLANIVGGNLKFAKAGEIIEHPRRELRFQQDRIYKYADWQYDYGYYVFLYATHFLRKEKLSFPPLWRYQDPPFMVQALHRAGSFVGCKAFSYCQSIADTPKKFNEAQVADMLDGMIKNLIYARRNNLRQLIIYTRRHFADNACQIEPFAHKPGISNLITMINQI